LSYADAARLVAGAAMRMRDMGLKPGDKIVTYLDDTIPLALFDLACAAIGVVPAPLSPVFSVGYVKRLAASLRAAFVYTSAQRAPDFTASAGIPAQWFKPSGQSARPELLPGGGYFPSLSSALELLENASANGGLLAPFMIQPTSGSTGEPKLVVRTHAGFARYAHYVGRELAQLHEPRFLATAALTHAFGLHMFTTALALGAEIAVPTQLDTAASLAEVRRLDPTVLPFTPRVLRSLYRQHQSARALPSVSHMFGPSAGVLLSAGGKCELDLLRFVAGQGLEVMEFYGSSEASLIALTPWRGWREGWAGRLTPDCTLRCDRDGELLVGSPGQMVEYFGAPELTAASYSADGLFRTGDLGEMDPDGYVKILGRKRDVFNTPEGSNIYPERLELMLESLPGVRQAFLVGDLRPYLSAFLVTEGASTAGQAADGYLDEAAHGDLYRHLRSQLAGINAGLEHNERILKFMVFDRCFDTSCYALVGPGKVRRDRKAFAERYAHVISEAYAPKGHPEGRRRRAPEPRQTHDDHQAPTRQPSLTSRSHGRR
jgi:long-chain acyl-CoA synthetase